MGHPKNSFPAPGSAQHTKRNNVSAYGDYSELSRYAAQIKAQGYKQGVDVRNVIQGRNGYGRDRPATGYPEASNCRIDAQYGFDGSNIQAKEYDKDTLVMESMPEHDIGNPGGGYYYKKG